MPRGKGKKSGNGHLAVGQTVPHFVPTLGRKLTYMVVMDDSPKSLYWRGKQTP
jgi:hypothetical protein